MLSRAKRSNGRAGDAPFISAQPLLSYATSLPRACRGTARVRVILGHSGGRFCFPHGLYPLTSRALCLLMTQCGHERPGKDLLMSANPSYNPFWAYLLTDLSQPTTSEGSSIFALFI